jgi:replication initiation and membrane attachment protein DnaB
MKVRSKTIEIKDIRDQDGYSVSTRILNEYASKIGVIGFALYLAYVIYSKDSVLPSEEKIAEKLMISMRTLRKYKRILEKYGLIKVEREGNREIIYIIL